jgi:hypothetical protein
MILNTYREHIAYTLIALMTVTAAIYLVRYRIARRRRALRMRGIKTEGR